MIAKEELIKIIEEIAPPELAEAWDNTGIQILADDRPVEKILVCLDVCDDTVMEAKEKGCDFILSHHPMFFAPIKQIDHNTASGGRAVQLIKDGISVYAAHTSFDTAAGGNNDYLCELLGLDNVVQCAEEPLLRIGEFISSDPVLLGDILKKTDSFIMGNKGLTYTGDANSAVKRAAVCTGAGADFAELAKRNGCELLITGDVKYHEFQNAQDIGIAVIDAGHFETEIFFADNMGLQLAERLGQRAIVIPSKQQESFLKRFHG